MAVQVDGVGIELDESLKPYEVLAPDLMDPFHAKFDVVRDPPLVLPVAFQS